MADTPEQIARSLAVRVADKYGHEEGASCECGRCKSARALILSALQSLAHQFCGCRHYGDGTGSECAAHEEQRTALEDAEAKLQSLARERDQLKEALLSLRNEASALIGFDETAVRAVVGITNVECLKRRIRETDALLARLSVQEPRQQENASHGLRDVQPVLTLEPDATASVVDKCRCGHMRYDHSTLKGCIGCACSRFFWVPDVDGGAVGDAHGETKPAT
jgi:hypothetical protein